MELILEILVEFDIEIAFPPVIVHGKAPALLDVLRPLLPGGPIEPLLHRHEEGIVLQPVRVLLHEAEEVRVLGDVAALIGQVQQREALLVDLAVVYPRGVAAEITGIAFLLRQQPFLNQSLQVDEIRVPRKGGKGLIRRVPIAGGGQGQNLPVALPRLLQPVNEIICLPGKPADAVL